MSIPSASFSTSCSAAGFPQRAARSPPRGGLNHFRRTSVTARQSVARTRRLDPDLNTIVRKALERELHIDIQSAFALAEDVQRYLANEPILAQPPSTVTQLRKLIARHKAPFAFAATLVVLLASFAASITIRLVERPRAGSRERRG